VPAGDAFGAGPITLVDTSSLNLLQALNEGVDLSVNYRRRTASCGEFHFNVTNTFALHYKRRTVFGAPFVDWINTSGSAPLRFRSTGSLIWERGAWTVGWSANYHGRYKVLAPPVTTSTAALLRQGGLYVSSQIYHHVFVAHRFSATPGPRAGRDSLARGLELQVGIENVFDRVPPYEGNSPNGFTYSTWGNLRLREYRVAVKKSF
jgi:iron complex outermembrane receptor protein